MNKTVLFPVVFLVTLLVVSGTVSAAESPTTGIPSSVERRTPARSGTVSFSRPVVDEPPAASANTVSTLFNEYRSSAGTSDSCESSSSREPRFSIGLRLLYHWLLSPKKGEPHHGSFIGSINRLEMHNSCLPSPYLRFSAPVGPLAAGFELSYTHYHISTRDPGGGDGAIDSDAVFLLALAEFPNASPLTPYIQIGAACAFNEFEPIPSWSEHNRRRFDLDDSIGFAGAIGCAWSVTGFLDLDLYVRCLDYDIDGKYIYRKDSRSAKPFTFTTENISAGLGLSYVF